MIFAPSILTVHDVTHEIFPEHLQDRVSITTLKRYAVAPADHVIAISKTKKYELCDIFSLPAQQLSVIRLGFYTFLRSIFPITFPNRPLLLYIGEGADLYENVRHALLAFAFRRRLFGDLTFIAFWRGAFTGSDRGYIERLGLNDTHVCRLQGIDTLLGFLSSNASALEHPSLYKGIGLPPGEVISAGCLVIAFRKAGSVSEVVGDERRLFRRCHD